MKRITLFVLCVLCAGFCSAQEINASGVTIKNYSAYNYDFVPLENNSDYFSAYISPKRVSKKDFKHQIAIYDKGSNTMSLKTITPSGDYLPITVFPAEDKNLGIYWIYNKKIGFTISTAELPLADPGTIHATTRLTIPAQNMDNFAAQSPDGTKHAVALMAFPKKEMPFFHVLIYDKSGNELAHSTFTPKISGTQYDYQDMVVSNEGEVTLLLRSAEKKGKNIQNTSIHIAIVSNDGEVTEYRVPAASFGEIHSSKLLLMKNGKRFIGGYYGETASKPSTGYFSYIFDPTTEDIVDEHHYALPSEQCAKNQIMLVMNFHYKIMAHNIFELDNGNIVMLGEHRAWCRCTQQTGNMVSTYYAQRTSDIVYQTFNGAGESDDSRMIRKLQIANSGSAPQELESSFNYGHSYEDLGLSFSAFQRGNNIYLVYNNNANDPDGESHIDVLSYGKSCIRFTTISENGEAEKKSIRKCDVKKNFFQTIWMVDENNVYFGTEGKPGYQIESMSIE